MNKQDEQLRQLIGEVLHSGVERSLAMQRLLALIPELPGIRKDPHPDYLEALNKTLEYTKDNINKFKTKFKVNIERESAESIRKKFIIWFNGSLRYRVLDLYRTQSLPLSLDAPIASSAGETSLVDILPNEGFNAPMLDGIEASIEAEQRQIIQRKALLLELYIERDYFSKLSNCYAKECKGCNCQLLLKTIFLNSPGEQVILKESKLKAEKKTTWRSIANKLGVNEQTLHTHWKKKCLPLLKEILADIENNIEQYAKDLLGEYQ